MFEEYYFQTSWTYLPTFWLHPLKWMKECVKFGLSIPYVISNHSIEPHFILPCFLFIQKVFSRSFSLPPRSHWRPSSNRPPSLTSGLLCRCQLRNKNTNCCLQRERERKKKKSPLAALNASTGILKTFSTWQATLWSSRMVKCAGMRERSRVKQREKERELSVVLKWECSMRPGVLLWLQLSVSLK